MLTCAIMYLHIYIYNIYIKGKARIFTRSIRSVISDYALTIAVLFVVALSYSNSVQTTVDRLLLPRDYKPTYNHNTTPAAGNGSGGHNDSLPYALGGVGTGDSSSYYTAAAGGVGGMIGEGEVGLGYPDMVAAVGTGGGGGVGGGYGDGGMVPRSWVQGLNGKSNLQLCIINWL